MDNILIIVPTYKPKKELFLPFIKELSNTFKNILIVNDGSGSIYDKLINETKKYNCIIINHDKNYGKGHALKTGFKYAIDNNYICTVACDCDNQHSVKDIYNCSKVLLENKNKLVLGVRDFSKSNVPFRSRFGNIITRNIFNIFLNNKITDTQTGLRGQSNDLMKKIINIEGEKFDFENNVLIYCSLNNICIKEVNIDTIYINKNKSSNFNPIKDSLCIYKNFYKYILPLIVCSIINIIIFVLLPFNNLINNYISLFLSSLLYYFLHDRFFYKHNYCNVLLIDLLIIYIISFIVYKFFKINLLIKVLIDLVYIILFYLLKHKKCNNS